jgi:hypothetical protein
MDASSTKAREDKLGSTERDVSCPVVYVYVDEMAPFAAGNWYVRARILQFCFVFVLCNAMGLLTIISGPLPLTQPFLNSCAGCNNQTAVAARLFLSVTG